MNPALRACVLLSCLVAGLTSQGALARDDATLVVKPDALAQDLPRYGLNLGGSGTWGAEQLRANVLANPGFEPTLDRAIVVVGRSEARRFSDDTDWLARPAGFWSGADFDVRSGAAAGLRGKILDSSRRAGNGPGEFATGAPVDALRPGNVVALTRDADYAIAPHWWKGKGRVAASGDIPPSSRGRLSLRLMATPDQPAEILHYLDNIGERAGKLLPVEGKWKLRFWARRVQAGARLSIRFDRSGARAFLDTEISPGPEWKPYEFAFEGRDLGPAGVLTLGFTATRGEILIDDVYLGEADPGPGGFRSAVVETLRSLRPGYLRDWQGQLGDTLENRLSGEFAHRPARYRPGEAESQFHYGLPDFLALCAAVGAQPWVSAPSTLSDDEWKKLGAYLRAAADAFGFREIHVEFGNENWNAIFRPGGIPDVAALAEVADRGFRLLRQGAGKDPRLYTVINAQFVNPESPARLGALSRETERISVAPYFLYRLDAGTDTDAALRLAFGEDATLLEREAATALRQGKRLSVYEVNFHTTLGNAGSEERNRVTTGAASGAALARRLLQASRSGVREQAVYTLAGFDSYVEGSRDLVRLWGITRDLSTANRLRPTGLALAMLNRVAGGPVHALSCAGEACSSITALAYGGGQKLALVSAGRKTLTLRLNLDCDAPQTYTMRLLDGSNTNLNNESRAEVGVAEQDLICREGGLRIALPPYSLATLESAEAR